MGKNRKIQDHANNVGTDRNKQESGESLPTVGVDAPKERFQSTAQVQSVDKAASLQTPNSNLIPKTTSYKGSQLKQEVAARVIEADKGVGGSVAGVSPAANSGLRTVKFSGDTGTIMGNVSGTPIMETKTHDKTRVEKRLSDVNKDINYLASEQVLVEYDNVPPLAASQSTVGYNGNPKNVAARSQKKTGATSAELLYDRSLDFIAKDQFVFAMGQVVKQENVIDKDYPTQTFDRDENGDMVQIAFARKRGNYAPSYINAQFTRTGSAPAFLSSFSVTEDDFSCNEETYDSVNRSASNHYIDLNAAELARQTIDQDAGSPNADHFNPLGRTVDQPSQTVMYLRDMEASTGATLFAAYKFAQKARGHYLNRTAKDGQDLNGPAFDALYGNIMAASDSATIYYQLNAAASTAYRGNVFFNPNGMAHGSAALIPAIFDSPSKYKTKADFVTAARGLRLPLQTADNNLDPFRAKGEFIAALNSVDAYSTIDRGYDPMSTVEITDNVRLIYPYSWTDTLAFTRKTYASQRVYSSKVFRYKYGAGSGNNTFYITVGDPVLNGVAWFLEQHASTIYEALSAVAEDNVVTLKIPVVHSTMHFSLWDLIVCASAPYIIYERTNSMKDILDYEQFYKYPFPELVSIKNANPMNAVNYGNPSAMLPLEVKQMVPSSACRWTLPELFYKLGSEDTMLPFYFSEDMVTFGGSSSAPTLAFEDLENFNSPVIRAGVRNAYLDDFFGMEIKDQMLCRDILTRVPGVSGSSAVNGYIYKYAQDAEGIPVLDGVTVTPKQIHSTPRQLGWFMDAYAGECNVITNDSSNVFGVISVSDETPITTVGPSYRAIMYRGLTSGESDAQKATRSIILGPGTINVDRSQAFTQEWVMRRSSNLNKGSDNFELDLSLYNGFTELNAAGTELAAVANQSTFKPYTYSRWSGQSEKTPFTANNVFTDGQALLSFHRLLWALIQKMPFMINPFDAAVPTGFIDPFGFAYLFNMAGFMTASYHEEVFNRANERQNLGYGYTSDPFIQDSPVFKDAYRRTQIG